MATVDRVRLEATVPVPAGRVWEIVRQFGEVATWNPFLAASRIVSGLPDQAGAEREVTTTDGDTVRERLVAQDDRDRSLTYEMVTFPIPVTAQRNTISVSGAPSDEGAIISFTAVFTPAGGSVIDVAEINRQAFATAAKGIAAFFGREATIKF